MIETSYPCAKCKLPMKLKTEVTIIETGTLGVDWHSGTPFISHTVNRIVTHKKC